jgi:drug/metabolite transporter (DMT)-like permease
MGNLIAFVAVLPLALPVTTSRPGDWMLLGYLGVFQIGLAYAFLIKGLRHVPAIEASLLLLIEPVLNPVWAWAFQDETPGPRTIAGGAVILMATFARGVVADRARVT